MINPSVRLLLRLQAQGRRRRMVRRLLQPRRIALTVLAAALLCVWLANALMSVLLREAADVEVLRRIIALTLTTYTAWHFVRVACFRPDRPLETPDQVHEMLSACPLRPEDLVCFHVAGALAAAALKASCVALLLFPDLGSPALGFLGVFAALSAVDLIRITVEIWAWGAPRRAYLGFRLAVLTSLGAYCYLAASTVREATVGALGAINDPNPLKSVQVFFERIVEVPAFDCFVVLWHWILAPIVGVPSDPLSLAWLMFAFLVLTLLASNVVRGYRTVVVWAARRERRQYDQWAPDLERATVETAVGPARVSQHARRRLARPASLGGVGPLAWRQSLGASRYAGGLLTALAVPGALSLIPLMAPVGNDGAVMSVVGGLAFYSFLLLPTALRFDFRRDLDRLAMLKSYPISNGAAALGQVAAPVLIASAFQLVVLTIAQVVRPAAPALVCGAVLLLGVLNVLIFSLENLIFLWYPHRLKQEGLEIFLRTTLTFTAKGVFFMVALAAVVAWGLPARRLADALGAASGVSVSAYGVFFGGILLLLAAAIVGVFALLARAFANFDPAEDQPA